MSLSTCGPRSGDIPQRWRNRLSIVSAVADRFHVTSSTNRQSIQRHGLDWRLMAGARGIAGSIGPEQQGCFLCREDEVDWFVDMNNTGGPVDVWAVSGVDEDSLVESPEGYEYEPNAIPPDRLRLVRSDIAPRDRNTNDEDDGGLSGSVEVIFRPGREPDET